MINLNQINTEERNPASTNLDKLSTLELVSLINSEDKKVAEAVAAIVPQIAQMVDHIATAFQQGGRFITLGAGTSGRLAVLDASECPPTYGVPNGMVVGLIAGGDGALRQAIEGAEDSLTLGMQDLKNINLTSTDVVVGLAASGRTPYVIGALQYAHSLGCITGAIACSANAAIAQNVTVSMIALVGPEVVTGSTRMKSGTAQKLILNMLSTGAMIKIGKVFGNLMVDVKPSNAKLIERQKRIVMQATGGSQQEAEQALQQTAGDCKAAIVMLLTGVDAIKAKELLQQQQGFIRKVLDQQR